ncbi:uncharacterized protein [Dermacentor albipictus]|uniref:uncharacterized protein n=1 Tax=Dermacentor albipictus TaxID=60249 RepID=UPI0038FC0B55
MPSESEKGDDVRHLGPLDSWSAFPFESHMGTIKKLLRKPQHPLEQLSNRIAETKKLQCRKKMTVSSSPLLTVQHQDGPLVPLCQGPQFKKVTFPEGIVLDTSRRNNCCKLLDGSVVVVENFAHNAQGTYDAVRQKLKQAEDGSDLGSEVDLGRGKSKKQRRALSSSPESVQRLPLPPPSMMKKAQKRDGRRIHKQSSHASTSRANDPNVCGDQGAVQCAQMCASETSESEGEAESGSEQDAMQESSGIERSFTAHSLMKRASQMGNTQCNNEKWHSSQSVAPISDDGTGTRCLRRKKC